MKDRWQNAGMNLPTLIGPLQLDAALCRVMGWDEWEIEEVTTHLRYLAYEHAERCAERIPSLWARAGNDLVYVGELPPEPNSRAGDRGPFRPQPPRGERPPMSPL